MNLSPHFTLAEMTLSQTAVRLGLANEPGPKQLANLKRTAALLEEVRTLVGKPITVSSGYRAPAVNKVVGGSSSSAHVAGLAADIGVTGMTPRALAELIRDSGIVFDQLIYEGGWVHIGLSEGAPRRQVLTARFRTGGVDYLPGIV